MANGCVNERKYGSYEDRSSNKQPLLGPVKVFTCKYCGRKFLNSRALGGHQNAHKKERTIWMTSGMSNGKSLAVEPHSLLGKPLQEGLLATGKDLQSCRRIGDSWRKQIFKEVADPDLGWPGSFHVYSSGSEAISASYAGKRVMEESSGGDVLDLVLSQQPDQSNVQGLDLDLHL